MIYIYDILLNFCDSDLIYDFYEWNNNDDVDNIKRIKLIHVSKNLYDKLLNYNVEVNDSFLIKIYKTCEVYKKKKIEVLDYCCLFSDGSRVLAIEFDKSGLSIYKSKLLLDEEDEIAVLASNLELSDVSLNVKSKALKDRFYTRNEMVVKHFLKKEIEDSYKNKKYDKLKFLYQEYYENSIVSYKQMKDELIKSINNSIDDKHKAIYDLLKLTLKKSQM